MLDLDYDEDSACDTDMNVVMTGAAALVEVQGTAEGAPFTRNELDAMVDLAEAGIRQLVAAQRAALESKPERNARRKGAERNTKDSGWKCR